MLLKRTAKEILRDAAVSIAQNTPITNFTAGSIARSIVEAMAPEIGTGDSDHPSLYDFAQEVLNQGYISKATEEYLDLIGGLFSYPRRMQEVYKENGLTNEPISDEMYRFELSERVHAAVAGNYASLRLALLTIPGVQDVVGKEYTHGTGSFSFVLIPEYNYDVHELKEKMNEKIKEVKSFGIRPNVILPVDVPFDVTIQLVFHESTSEQQKSYIRSEVKTYIHRYIGTFEKGKSIIYNDFVQEVMNVHNKIMDFKIIKFYLNNEPALLMNHEIMEDERIIPQNIQVL